MKPETGKAVPDQHIADLAAAGQRIEGVAPDGILLASNEQEPAASAPDQMQTALTLSELVFWRPGRLARWLVALSALLVSLALASLHLAAGFAYEFHLFFGIPVFLVAWYWGGIPGYAMTVVVVALWLAADLGLDGSQAEWLPLLFNSFLRSVLFASAVGLLVGLRSVLDRESALAREDALTGLPNRREFHQQGTQALALAQRQNLPTTAVFLDLDHFKEVNDLHGHEAGDQVLVTVAEILRSSLRASDVCGRLGGDEFALLLPGMNASDAERYVRSLRCELLQAMQVRHWPVRFSIGVASYEQTPADFLAVIAAADALMYEVKHGGRDRILLRAY